MLLTRRSFFKTIIGGMFFTKLFGGKWEHAEKSFWKDQIFRQGNIKIAKSKIEARINGVWKKYQPVKLSDEFMDWNIERRLSTLEKIKRGERPSFGGPHSAAVATYGTKRLDSQVTINNAIKGFGFLPRPEIITDVIKDLERTYDDPIHRKLDFLKKFYSKKETLDRTKQISLELYATEEFETHTFLNILENPVASIVFLDVPSYEIRSLVQMVHPNDKEIGAYEKLALKYVNLTHSYFHGKFSKDFIALIFHVIELFDNSPGKMRGVRVVPVLEE